MAIRASLQPDVTDSPIDYDMLAPDSDSEGRMLGSKQQKCYLEKTMSNTKPTGITTFLMMIVV